MVPGVTLIVNRKRHMQQVANCLVILVYVSALFIALIVYVVCPMQCLLTYVNLNSLSVGKMFSSYCTICQKNLF